MLRTWRQQLGSSDVDVENVMLRIEGSSQRWISGLVERQEIAKVVEHSIYVGLSFENTGGRWLARSGR